MVDFCLWSGKSIQQLDGAQLWGGKDVEGIKCGVQQKKCQVMEKERCGEVEQDTGWAGRCEDKGREGDSAGSSVTRRTHTHKKKVPR